MLELSTDLGRDVVEDQVEISGNAHQLYSQALRQTKKAEARSSRHLKIARARKLPPRTRGKGAFRTAHAAQRSAHKR